MKQLYRISFAARCISLGFAAVILMGSILLILPCSVQEGVKLQYIDSLYTSRSYGIAGIGRFGHAYINLRGRFGLNIIAIENNGLVLDNICPDYEFRLEDILLLVGDKEGLLKMNQLYCS